MKMEVVLYSDRHKSILRSHSSSMLAALHCTVEDGQHWLIRSNLKMAKKKTRDQN